jgi:arylformamidase
MQIIDISLKLNNGTPIYPKNVPLSVSIHSKMPESATQTSSITMGSHTGTHIDAPGHAVEGSPMLDQLELEHFIGLCRVLDFSSETGAHLGRKEAVTTEMLKEKNIQKGERILLKTENSVRGFETFYDDYVYLDGDGADYLARLSVMLVGIDALSIKKRGSSDHRPHLSLLSKNIPIIEGLNLMNVEEGSYELFCPPMNFTGIDGAPARAILIKR